MTLVLNSHHSAFLPTSSPTSSHLNLMRWSPMTSTLDFQPHTTLGLPSHNYASSASSSNAAGGTPNVLRKTSNGAVKKRASRAGTRSVSTLSAAQLERKRANDREAQRAIRQRTKDHIDSLEATLNDVRQTLEAREKLLAASHQRNRELEEENAIMRMRLSEANLPTGVPQKFSRPVDPHPMSAPQSAASEASGSISQRSNSNAAAVGNFTHQNGRWAQLPHPQQHSGSFAQLNGGLVLSTDQDASRGATGWRARDSPSTVTAIPPGVHPPQALPFTPTTDRPTWTSVSHQYEFGSAAAQEAAANFQQQQQQQPPSSAFPNTPQQGFHPPLLPPQHDFQHMPVNNTFYHYTQQENFSTQQQQFQSNPAQQPSQAAFQASQAQVQQSPASATSYRNPGAEQAFNHSFHPPMQFRDDADSRTYNNMAHYPAG